MAFDRRHLDRGSGVLLRGERGFQRGIRTDESLGQKGIDIVVEGHVLSLTARTAPVNGGVGRRPDAMTPGPRSQRCPGAPVREPSGRRAVYCRPAAAGDSAVRAARTAGRSASAVRRNRARWDGSGRH